jgi:uncharacterized protein (TIGR04255 family)
MSLSSTNSPLPEYANPPLVETVLGVQFERLPDFTNGHLGAFWKTLDPAEWPRVSDAPPLQPQFEQFAEAAKWARRLQFQVSPIPTGRLQIENQSKDRMIQLQNGRLHFNWLGIVGGTYPRYESVRTEFVNALERFKRFVVQSQVGSFLPNQWEATYINQVPRGTLWNSPADWTFFRPLCGVPTIENVVLGEDVTGEWHFIIPEQRGRLHIEWRHALRAVEGEEEREVIQLTFTARGPVAANGEDKDSILAGLDLGRETIVRTFAALASENANRFWGLKNAAQ